MNKQIFFKKRAHMFCTTLCAAMFFLVNTSRAYIPPTFFIYKQIAKKHTDLKNLTIKSRVQFLSPSQSPRGPALIEYLSVSDSGHVVIHLKNTSEQNVAQITRNLLSQSERAPHLYDIILNADFERIMKNARYHGFSVKSEAALYQRRKGTDEESLPYIPEESVRFIKDRGKVFLGITPDKGSDNEPPALWVDKASLLPQRLFIRGPSSEKVQIIMGMYAVHQSSFYPKNIMVYVGEDPWVRIDLLDMKSTSSSPAAVTAGGVQIYDDHGGLEKDLSLYGKVIR